MAAQLQTITNEEQIRLILKTEDKTKLTHQQLTWIASVLFPTLQQAFGKNKVKDANQALILVQQNPEIILSIFSKEKNTGTQVEGALLTHLVREMKQDKAKLAESINTIYANLPNKERDNVKFIIATLQNQKLQETIAANQKIQENLKQAKQNLNPKGTGTLANTDKLARTLIEAINKGESLNLPQEKLEEIEEKLVQAIVANPKQTYQDTPQPINQEDLITLAITTIAISTGPEILQDNPIAETVRVLEKGFRPVAPEDYQQIMTFNLHTEEGSLSPPQHIYDPENNQVIILPPSDQIATGTETQRTIEKTIQISAPFLLTEPGKDTLENTIKETGILNNNARDLTPILNASEEVISPITEGQKQTVIRIVNTINPQAFTHSKPNGEASKASAILEKTGNPEDKNLSQATELASMGLTSQQVQHMVAIAQKQIDEGKDTAVTRLVNSNPEVIKAMTIIGIEIQRIEATTPPTPEPGQKQTPSFHQEISQKTGKIRSIFQPIYNKFSSRIPTAISKPLNVIFHPIDSLKSWFGRRTGKYITKKLGKTVIAQAGKAFLKNGVKQGTQWLLKQGIKLGIKSVAYLAGLATGPLAPLVGVIIEAADFIYSKILKPLAKFAIAPLIGMVTDIFGKPNLKEDIPAAIAGVGAGLGSALGAIPTVLATASSAAFAATTAAGTTIIIASGITIIFYIAAFNMGPIISSMAQMGMPITGGVGSGSGVGGGTYITDPNATYNDTGTNAGTPSNKTECMTFSDSPRKWSDDQKRIIRGIVQQLPPWLSEGACKKGAIDLEYGGNLGDVGGEVNGNKLTIYDNGFNLLTIVHELGHIYGNNLDVIMQEYHLANNPPWLIESKIFDMRSVGNPSDYYLLYSNLKTNEAKANEGFSEMIRYYITKGPAWMATNLPLHYKFMQDYIIK